MHYLLLLQFTFFLPSLISNRFEKFPSTFEHALAFLSTFPDLRRHDIKRLIKAGLRIRNCYVSGGDRTVKKSIDARRTVGVGPRTAGLDIGRREKEISIENRG